MDDQSGSAFPLPAGGIAMAITDPEGRVLFADAMLRSLTGRTEHEGFGAFDTLVADGPVWAELTATPLDSGPRTATLRHRDGPPVPVALHVRPVAADSGGGAYAVLVAPLRRAEEWRLDQAIVRALFEQASIGAAILDPDLGFIRRSPHRLPGESHPWMPIGRRLREFLGEDQARTVERQLGRVRDTGEPLIRSPHLVRVPDGQGGVQQLSLSALRLCDGNETLGVLSLFADVTEEARTAYRVALLHAAADRIGTTLDVATVARELADVLVPAFADWAMVDLADAVVQGDDPQPLTQVSLPRMHRSAVAGVGPPWADMLAAGDELPDWSGTIAAEVVSRGGTFMVPVLPAPEDLPEPPPPYAGRVTPPEAHSLIIAALRARGLPFGWITVWRTEMAAPFDKQDSRLLGEIGSRAALALDNARRYTREHRSAATLQRSLLPSAVTATATAEAKGAYLPSVGGAGIGGDWFDVIPLSSLRVGFAVGDVVGHGLHASATMGRLRTAVHTLADLDLDPVELVTHLDDLVTALDHDEQAPPGVAGATFLYTEYDPVASSCTLVSAGHPPPLLLRRSGAASFVDVSPGPPLGVGGEPFEPVELSVSPGDLLVFYTDGLVVQPRTDIAEGMERLSRCVAAHGRDDLGPLAERVLALAPTPHRDDVALLLVRPSGVPAEDVAEWEFPAEAEVVPTARQLALGQLAAWDLDHLAFTTELIVSELVTNALRYAGGPIGLRMIRRDILVCEVTDPSSTQPRLRRARSTDEGGRGLFLVAQLSNRWGSRFTRSGKTIWTEQTLDALTG